jgi:hypothetical protein
LTPAAAVSMMRPHHRPNLESIWRATKPFAEVYGIRRCYEEQGQGKSLVLRPDGGLVVGLA